MDLRCDYPGCGSNFYWSGRGQKPHYCITHRKLHNRELLKTLYKTRKQESLSTPDPESIIRPRESHLFSGPGLFESLPELFDRVVAQKSHELGMPKSYIINSWIHGQAGRQTMRSFLRPDL